jgi:C-3',4' desaturase CrtD
MKRVLVIGAGVGGATTAALLAKAGYDVTLLEAHVYAGGCAGTFYHQGYRFDAGATLAGGFHSGGPHDVVAQRLGIQWDVHAVDPAWQVHLPDRALTRYGNSDQWQMELARVFGDGALTKFFAELEYISDSVWQFSERRPALPMQSLADTVRTARAIRPDTIRTLPHVFQTLGNWARESGVSDVAAKTFLDAQLLISAQTLADRANALFGAAAIDLPRKGVNHVRGGIGQIATQLVTAARDHGAQVQFRQTVKKLEVCDGKIIAAHTDKGLCVECDLCVANVTPWNLAQFLGDAAPSSLQREVERRAPMWGAFTLYLGIEDDATQTIDHHQVVQRYAAPLGETNSIFMSLSERGDTSRAPVGQRAMTISTHTDTAAWWRLRNTAGAEREYEDRVAQYSEAMLIAAERVMPDLRRRIRLQLPGTPVTFQFYTRRHAGGVGGVPLTSIFGARGPQTGLRNAWLVGDSIFPGQSTAGVTLGALRVVEYRAKLWDAR